MRWRPVGGGRDLPRRCKGRRESRRCECGRTRRCSQVIGWRRGIHTQSNTITQLTHRYEPRTYIPPRELQAPVLGQNVFYSLWRIIRGMSPTFHLAVLDYLAADSLLHSRFKRDSRKERCRPLRLYPLPTHDGESDGPYLAPLMGRSTAHQCDRPEYRRQGARHVYVGQYRRISYKAVLGASDPGLYLCLYVLHSAKLPARLTIRCQKTIRALWQLMNSLDHLPHVGRDAALVGDPPKVAHQLGTLETAPGEYGTSAGHSDGLDG